MTTTTRFTFNTDRGYSAAGQIIHVEFTPHAEQSDFAIECDMIEGWLAYYDETRGLWGKFNTIVGCNFDRTIDEAAIRRGVMFLYDNPDALQHDITYAEALALKAEEAT